MVRKLLVNSDRKILGKADGKIYGITSAIVSGIDGVTENDTQITITTDKQLRVNSNSNIGLTKTNEVTLLPSAITTLKIPYAGAVVNAKNLSPENIAKNIEVLGVIGTYDNGIDGVTEKYGTITIDENVVSSTVRVYGNKTIESYNTGGSINSFVDCDLKVLTGKLNITHVNNAGSVIATNLEPQNIKKDVTILGITGTYDNSIKGVTIDEENFALNIDDIRPLFANIRYDNRVVNVNGEKNVVQIYKNTSVHVYDGAVVGAVNLSPPNIKEGVTILGITGTYSPETTTNILVEQLNSNTIEVYNDENLTLIRHYLFYNNTNLKEVSFKYVREIFAYGFYNTGIVEVTDEQFPSLRIINLSAFQKCEELITVSLTKATVVDDYAFADCPKLTNVTLNSITSTGAYTFKNCVSLKTVKLPKLSSIYGGFINCTSLTDIYIGKEGVVLLQAQGWIEGVPQGLKLHVRAEYVDQYATGENWAEQIASGKVVFIGDYSD